MGGILCTLAAWGWLFVSCGCGMATMGAGGGSGFSGGSASSTGISWAGIVAATTAACLLEAATTQLDNIFVPLQLFALLCAAGV